MGFNWKKVLGVAQTVGVPIAETVCPATRPIFGGLQVAFDQHGKGLDPGLFVQAFLPLLEDVVGKASTLTPDQQALIIALIKGALMEAIVKTTPAQ
jgi:hypothetical protein